MKNKYKEKTCVDCGRKFMPTSGRQMRCPFCIFYFKKQLVIYNQTNIHFNAPPLH